MHLSAGQVLEPNSIVPDDEFILSMKQVPPTTFCGVLKCKRGMEISVVLNHPIYAGVAWGETWHREAQLNYRLNVGKYLALQLQQQGFILLVLSLQTVLDNGRRVKDQIVGSPFL